MVTAYVLAAAAVTGGLCGELGVRFPVLGERPTKPSFPILQRVAPGRRSRERDAPGSGHERRPATALRLLLRLRPSLRPPAAYQQAINWAPPYVAEDLRLARVQSRTAFEQLLREENEARAATDPETATRHEELSSAWRGNAGHGHPDRRRSGQSAGNPAAVGSHHRARPSSSDRRRSRTPSAPPGSGPRAAEVGRVRRCSTRCSGIRAGSGIAAPGFHWPGEAGTHSASSRESPRAADRRRLRLNGRRKAARWLRRLPPGSRSGAVADADGNSGRSR
jgi:hypothetical protein